MAPLAFQRKCNRKDCKRTCTVPVKKRPGSTQKKVGMLLKKIEKLLKKRTFTYDRRSKNFFSLLSVKRKNIMVGDPRYIAAKRMVENGDITTFNQLFTIIPKSIVAADLGTQNVRFTMLMNHVERFTLQELFLVGNFFELEEKDIFQLAFNQYAEQRKNKLGK